MNKILHLTFEMKLGGTQQVIRQLILGLDPATYQNHVLCIDGIIGELGESIVSQNLARVEAYKREPGFDFKLVQAIIRYVKANQIDIVHCHQYSPYVYGLLAGVFTKKKVIFTEHGRFYPDGPKWKRKLINPLLCILTHAVTTISQATAKALVEFENIPRKKIDVVYNGVRVEKTILSAKASKEYKSELGLSYDKLIYGTISRLDPIKNHKMMIRAFAKFNDQNPNSELLIIGNGEMRSELEQLVMSLGVEQSVIFTGFITEPQRYLAVMDVFLLPSFSEGTSMTLLESMAQEKPSIVTSVGGNPEIVIDNHTGMIIPNNDEDALVSAMTTMAQDPLLKDTLAKNAYKRYQEQFTEEHMINHYEQLYQRLI